MAARKRKPEACHSSYGSFRRALEKPTLALLRRANHPSAAVPHAVKYTRRDECLVCFAVFRRSIDAFVLEYCQGRCTRESLFGVQLHLLVGVARALDGPRRDRRKIHTSFATLSTEREIPGPAGTWMRVDRVRSRRVSPPVGLLHVAMGSHGNLAVRRIRTARLHELRLAGLSVSHQHRDGDPAGRTSAAGCTAAHGAAATAATAEAATDAADLDALARRPLRLVPVILEPDLHLRRREAYYRREMLALRRAQVPLLPEAPLELVRLGLREEDPPLPLLAVLAARRAAVLAMQLRAAVLAAVAAAILLELLVVRLQLLARLLVVAAVVLLGRGKRQVRDCRARGVRLGLVHCNNSMISRLNYCRSGLGGILDTEFFFSSILSTRIPFSGALNTFK